MPETSSAVVLGERLVNSPHSGIWAEIPDNVAIPAQTETRIRLAVLPRATELGKA